MLRYFLLWTLSSVMIFAGETFSLEEQAKLLKDWKNEYQAAYDEDAENQKLQTFDQYWSYIEQFFLTAKIPYSLRYYYGLIGWFDTIDKLSPKLPEEDRKKYRERILKLGKEISKEWAKENPKRKFFSTAKQGKPNLENLNKKMSPFMDQTKIKDLQNLDEFLVGYEKHFGINLKEDIAVPKEADSKETAQEEIKPEEVNTEEKSPLKDSSEDTKEKVEVKEVDESNSAKTEESSDEDVKTTEALSDESNEKDLETDAKEEVIEPKKEVEEVETKTEAKEVSTVDKELMKFVAVAEDFDVKEMTVRIDKTIDRVSNIIESVHQAMAR